MSKYNRIANRQLKILEKIEKIEQNKKEEKPQIDFNAEKIIGLDVEKEDRDVGIFGNEFILGIETDKNKIWISMYDDEFMSLLELLKPYYEKQKAEEDYSNEMYADYLRENETRNSNI